MIQPVRSEEIKSGDPPIHKFRGADVPIYTDKINGHFIWDVDPTMCDPDCPCRRDDDDIIYIDDEKGPCNSKKRHRPDDPDSPWVGIKNSESKKPLDIYKEELRVL